MKHAFTLIELLIVVAIIAILAAIAVPNFLEAQTRAKVTRAKSDMRTIATGLESYFVDWNKYPYDGYNTGTAPPAPYNSVGYWYLNFTLTSPVSYLTTCDFQDQFRVQATTRQYQGLRYISTSSTWGMDFPTLTGRSSAASFLPDCSVSTVAGILIVPVPIAPMVLMVGKVRAPQVLTHIILHRFHCRMIRPMVLLVMVILFALKSAQTIRTNSILLN